MTSATLAGTAPLVLAPAVLVRHRWGWQWVIPKCPYCGKKHTHGGEAPTRARRRARSEVTQ